MADLANIFAGAEAEETGPGGALPPAPAAPGKLQQPAPGAAAAAPAAGAQGNNNPLPHQLNIARSFFVDVEPDVLLAATTAVAQTLADLAVQPIDEYLTPEAAIRAIAA